MHRRDLLKMLAAAGASLVFPTAWTPPAEAGAIVRTAEVSDPADYLMDILIGGQSRCSELGHMRIYRPDGPMLMHLVLNTFGGVLRWVAAPGEELRLPLHFEMEGNMTVNLIGFHNGRLTSVVWEPYRETPFLVPQKTGWMNDFSGGTPLLPPELPEIPDVFRF